MAGRQVFAALSVRPPVTDPDAVAALFGLARRAPVDDHIMVESRRPSTLVVSVTIVRVRMMIGGGDAAHVMMVPGLGCAGIVLVADDLRPILAELAIHRRLAIPEFSDTISESAEHSLV